MTVARGAIAVLRRFPVPPLRGGLPPWSHPFALHVGGGRGAFCPTRPPVPPWLRGLGFGAERLPTVVVSPLSHPPTRGSPASDSPAPTRSADPPSSRFFTHPPTRHTPAFAPPAPTQSAHPPSSHFLTHPPTRHTPASAPPAPTQSAHPPSIRALPRLPMTSLLPTVRPSRHVRPRPGPAAPGARPVGRGNLGCTRSAPEGGTLCRPGREARDRYVRTGRARGAPVGGGTGGWAAPSHATQPEDQPCIPHPGPTPCGVSGVSAAQRVRATLQVSELAEPTPGGGGWAGAPGRVRWAAGAPGCAGTGAGCPGHQGNRQVGRVGGTGPPRARVPKGQCFPAVQRA